MKKLYTAADIEALAADGQRTISLGPSVILTPLARDRARELGVQLRSGEEARPAASPRPQTVSRPPVAATGLASDAQAAFIGLLQQAREIVADTPHLARCFDDLLRAVEQSDALRLPGCPQPAGLPDDRRQALAAQLAKLDALARYLFGPHSPNRRFDILWTLKTINSQLTSNND
jgi:hypothetical protein